MKKTAIISALVLAIMLCAGQKVKMSSVISPDFFKKGFSATVKTTSDMPMMPAQEPYTVYTDGEGNTRTDMKDNISIYVEEKGKNMIYNYEKKTKTYTVFSPDDMSGMMEGMGGVEKPGVDEEETVEKVGSEMFAGVKCDKYKVIMEKSEDDEEEMQGESFVYIDPVKKMFVGMSMQMGPYTMKMEYTDIKQGVDKSVFKPLTGYKKVN
jgi:hypothetical protein